MTRLCYFSNICFIITVLLTSCGDDKARALNDLNKKGIDKTSESLITQIIKRDLKTIDQLLLSGVTVNTTTQSGQFPLSAAVKNSDLTSVNLLLKAGADPNKSQVNELCTLSIAIEKNDLNIAQALIFQGSSVDVKMTTGESALAWCMKNEKFSMANLLIDYQVNLNAKTNDGNTPLIIAIEKNQVALAEKMITKGTDLNVTNSNNLTAIDIALKTGNQEIFHQLINRSSIKNESQLDTLLWKSYNLGLYQNVGSLLKANAPAVKLDQYGRTLLHAVIDQKNYILAQKLLLTKRPLGAGLHSACMHGDKIAVEMILSFGTPANLSIYPYQDTPLTCSIRGNNVSIVEYLLHHGADVSLCGLENQSPLHCAIAYENAAIVAILLEHGAKANDYIQTPVNSHFLSAIKGNGMRWYLMNDRKITPLMIAANSGNLEIASSLLKHGAKKEVWTSKNKTWVLNFASRRSDVKMMRLLLDKNPHIEERHVRICLKTQQATVSNSLGETIFTSRISSGKKGFATPTGTFVITNKNREWHSTLYHNAPMPYFQRLNCGDFGLHQGIVPGYPASHGCLRVPQGNVKKLYSITQIGDRVTIE
jgi:ankyrin repeat protein